MSEISSRIDNLLSENKLKRADLVRGTGISEGTIRGWIRGQTPSAEAAYKVAQYFDVSVEWLITGEDQKIAPYERYSPEEKQLIEIFRNLDDRDKNAVLTLAKSLEDQYSSSESKNTTAG